MSITILYTFIQPKILKSDNLKIEVKTSYLKVENIRIFYVL